jgi:hypothetical protein
MPLQKQDALTKRINAKYNEIERRARSTVAAAIELGEMLTEKKARLAHGEFGTWVREHFAGSERHAQRFMQLYREQNKLAKTTSVSDLTLTDALNAIAAPKETGDGMSPEERLEKIKEHTQRAEEKFRESREHEKNQYKELLAYAHHPDAAKDLESTRKFLLELLDHTLAEALRWLRMWCSEVRHDLREHLEPLADASKNGATGAMLERVKERDKGHESEPLAHEEQQLAGDVCPDVLELYQEQREELRRWVDVYQRIERAETAETMAKVLEDIAKMREEDTLAVAGVAFFRGFGR